MPTGIESDNKLVFLQLKTIFELKYMYSNLEPIWLINLGAWVFKQCIVVNLLRFPADSQAYIKCHYHFEVNYNVGTMVSEKKT